MAKDLDIIKQLEQTIKKNLPSLENINSHSFIGSDRCGYVLDDNSNVIRLGLSKRELIFIPNEIFRLTNLKALNLAYNFFRELPSEIVYLEKLEFLQLYHNRLHKIPPEIGKLNKLKHLGLAKNPIRILPAEILDLKLDFVEHIVCEGICYSRKKTELQSPPIEIIEKGRIAVEKYFNSIQSNAVNINEVKISLIGSGGVGKTSIMKKLLGEPFDECENQTHGINIKDWNINVGSKRIHVHIWDFGGQEIMYAMHQFFLSKGGLFILVLDARNHEDPEYWLKNIDSFIGETPLIVVINKIDQDPIFDINRGFLQGKFRGIKGFVKVSCATGEGFEKFVKQLKITLQELKIKEMPTIWNNVKTQLEQINKSFISYEDYINICERSKVTDETTQNILVDFLHNLGVILHFKDFELQDTYVLDPKWVTNAVYKIVCSELLAKNNGKLKLNQLDIILNNVNTSLHLYPRDKFRYLIGLMKKFELCYEIDAETILIPSLLKIQEPSTDFFDYTKSLKFRLEYNFLPKSIMPQFIFKTHKDIKDELCWQTGVVLEDNDFSAVAVIKADERDKKIFIYINGRQKREFLSVIRKTFKDISKGFEKLSVNEVIPLPGASGFTVKYENLKGHELLGESKIIIGELEQKFSVKKLLDGIEEEKERRELNVKMEVNDMSKTYIDNSIKTGVQVKGEASVNGDIISAIANDHSKVEQSNQLNQSNNGLIDDLLDLLKTELSKLNIDKAHKEAIDMQIEILEKNAKSDNKNTVLMKSMFESIKAIIQGALGSSMGAGLVEIFKRVGMMTI